MGCCSASGRGSNWCRDIRSGFCTGGCHIFKCSTRCPDGYYCTGGNKCQKKTDQSCIVPLTTCGGTAGRAQCVFPFTWRGTTYTRCTSEGHTEPWCFTERDNSKWGNCECPGCMHGLWTDGYIMCDSWSSCQQTDH